MSESELIVDRLVANAEAGDAQALGELLERYRERLRGIVEFRMDSRLRGRLDADDILQEAFVEATQRFRTYTEERTMPFFLWLRFLTIQKLMQLHRMHLGAQARDADREIAIYSSPHPHATSAVLAAHLLGKQTSPSAAAVRAETRFQVERALNAMEPIDREVLALRHFEQLSNRETAELLQLSDTAANNRYIRALKRLKRTMDESAGSMKRG